MTETPEQSRAFLLESGWRFREVYPAERADFGAGRLPEDVTEHGWQRAVVPGGVHLDLMRLGRLKDPRYDRNERGAQWIESHEWLYEVAFPIPPDWVAEDRAEGTRVEIVFEQLDTFATIYINSKLAGKSSTMFCPCVLDISPFVHAGENAVLVHFESANARCAQRENEHGREQAAYDRTRVHARRPQFATGWSMAPRLSGCGLVGPVTVRLVEGVRLKSVQIPISQLRTDVAQLSIETEIEALCEASITLSWTIERLDPTGSGRHYEPRLVWTGSRNFAARPGSFRYTEPVTIENPTLWWPAGWQKGRQTIYRLKTVASRDEKVFDDSEVIFGLRQIELVMEADERGESFYFRVNGEKVFARGANWIPPDVFPAAVRDTDYRQLLDMAHAANINMLRVWGGGLYENEAFYRRCDELGIMVWQDFMFAAGNYPHYDSLWKDVQKEIVHQMRRLRNHPCIALWCGGSFERTSPDAQGTSSFYTDRKPNRYVERLFPKLSRDLDTTRPFWKSTPSGGETPNSSREGDHHEWTVWDGWENPDRYRRVRARFITEFGFQALPHAKTMAAFAPGADQTLNQPEVEGHQKQPDGNIRLFRYVVGGCRPPADFDEAVYLTQWMQAEALVTAIDAWRANKPETMGALVWHLNDCWPGVTWSLIDYERRPKLAYWAVRQAFSPISLILTPSEIGLRAVAVHDGSPRDGDQRLVFRLKAFGLDGTLHDWKDQDVVLPAGGKSELGIFTLRALGIQDPVTSVVVGELLEGKNVVAARLYSPLEPKRIPFPEPTVECTLDCVVAGVRAIFVLRANNIVRGVELDFEGVPGVRVRYENCFDLWPQREVWVQVDVPPDTSEEQLLSGVRYRCLNDSVAERRIAWRRPVVALGEGRAQDAALDSSDSLTVRLRSVDMIPKLKM